MNRDDLVQEWMNYAVKDLESAEYLTGMKPEPLEIICFHCQQAVEKALKAYLLSIGKRPPKTHDLDELIVFSDNSEIAGIRDLAIPLNDYSIIARYPSVEIVTKDDSFQALKSANAIFSLIKNLI